MPSLDVRRPSHGALRCSPLLFGLLSTLASCDPTADRSVPYAGSAGAPASRVDPSDFLGADACGSCHAREYQRWASSTHARAGGPPTPEAVLPPFDGSDIGFADATVRPSVLPDGRYAFLVQWNGRMDTLDVAGVVGGGHMVGGGTQGFFTRWADGTLRFLPFDWSRHEESWFCSRRHPEPGEWLRVDTETRLTQCADWPPRRVLGHVPGMAGCDGCHGSRIRTAFDPGTGGWRTRVDDLAIDCESCHGPGRTHVERVGSGGTLAGGDLAIASLATLDEDASLDVCFRCHATRLVLHEGDFPGDPLQDNASLLLPLLTDRPFLPDGRVATFAYQLNHRASACYLDGQMTCTSCHSPHTQGYRDEHGGALEGRVDDGQCLGCHASKGAQPERHTFHPAGSEGSTCVACHMPYRQHPEIGSDVRYTRSDHTIAIPRPGLDERLGILSACAGCHDDRPPHRLAEQLAERWGVLKPWRPPVAALARAGGTNDPSSAVRLLLSPGAGAAMAQAAGVSQYAVRFIRPDMDALPAGARRALMGLIEDPDIDVAALAAASLHLARGDDADVVRALERRLTTLGDRAFRLRDRWAEALRYLGDVYRARGTLDDARMTYLRALEVEPDHARTLESLGLALAALQDHAEAEAVFRRAEELDSTRAAPLVHRALAVGRQGRAEEELTLLEHAVRRFAYDPLAQFQLGNAYLRRRRMLEAGDAFRRTLELDASLASPRVGLAQVLAAQGREQEAREQLRLALAFQPGEPQARALLDRLDSP